MSSKAKECAPYEIIEQEKEAYLEELPGPESKWPIDVCILYEHICESIFETGNNIKDIYKRIGIRNNNISSRFRHFVGRTPKDFVLSHHIKMAKRLIRYKELSNSQTATADTLWADHYCKYYVIGPDQCESRQDSCCRSLSGGGCEDADYDENNCWTPS